MSRELAANKRGGFRIMIDREKKMAMRGSAFTIVPVAEMDRAVEFYRDVVGLSARKISATWARFDLNGGALLLRLRGNGQEKPVGTGQGAHLGVEVDNLEEEYNRLTGRDVKFARGPEQSGFGRVATLFDPDGNAIDLVEWTEPGSQPVTTNTVVNNIIISHPETMEVFENHGIRICGGCLVLLNAPVYETAEYSGLDSKESSELVQELNEKLAELARAPQMEQL